MSSCSLPLRGRARSRSDFHTEWPVRVMVVTIQGKHAPISIQGVHACHFFLRQLEIQDVEVLFDSRRSDRFRYDNHALLKSPAQCYLGCGLQRLLLSKLGARWTAHMDTFSWPFPISIRVGSFNKFGCPSTRNSCWLLARVLYPVKTMPLSVHHWRSLVCGKYG